MCTIVMKWHDWGNMTMLRLLFLMLMLAGASSVAMADPITGPSLDQVRQPPLGIQLDSEQWYHNQAEQNLHEKEARQRSLNEQNTNEFLGHDAGSADELQQIQQNEAHHLDD